MGSSEPAEIVEIVQNPVTPPKRQHRNVETKRKLVEATLVPGASVARVARTNGVNTNQLFTWRRLYSIGSHGFDSFAIFRAATRSTSVSHRLWCLAGRFESGSS